MSTKASTMEYLLDQLSGLPAITTRKMFGEYALYFHGKVVAFICDDQFFLKPTESGKRFLGKIEEKPAYPGSKMYYYISGERWEDDEWLAELIQVTAAELPEPKPKKVKIKVKVKK